MEDVGGENLGEQLPVQGPWHDGRVSGSPRGTQPNAERRNPMVNSRWGSGKKSDGMKAREGISFRLRGTQGALRGGGGPPFHGAGRAAVGSRPAPTLSLKTRALIKDCS